MLSWQVFVCPLQQMRSYYLGMQAEPKPSRPIATTPSGRHASVFVGKDGEAVELVREENFLACPSAVNKKQKRVQWVRNITSWRWWTSVSDTFTGTHPRRPCMQTCSHMPIGIDLIAASARLQPLDKPGACQLLTQHHLQTKLSTQAPSTSGNLSDSST